MAAPTQCRHHRAIQVSVLPTYMTIHLPPVSQPHGPSCRRSNASREVQWLSQQGSDPPVVPCASAAGSVPAVPPPKRLQPGHNSPRRPPSTGTAAPELPSDKGCTAAAGL